MNVGNDHLMFGDGSSLGNPGPGGWGTILVLGGERVVELGGHEKHTTNNRMELYALIEGLRRLEEESGNVTIYTDSAYVVNGATKWSENWKKRGWKTTAKTDVENRDLWEALLPLIDDRKKFGQVRFEHIRGHVGIEGNERADEIAVAYASGAEVELYEGMLADYAFDIMHIAADDERSRARAVSRSRSRAKAYSYISLINGRVARHDTWAECENRVKGKSGAKYKKALSRSDEEEILKSWGIKQRH